MTGHDSSSATLVVIEFGAAWPRWLPAGNSSHVACVAQHYEGEPRSLIQQVASRVARLEAAGWQFADVVFSLNARRDPDAVAARSVVARGLLSRLRPGSRMVLSASAHLERLSPVQGLVTRLSQEARRQGISLSAAGGSEPQGVRQGGLAAVG